MGLFSRHAGLEEIERHPWRSFWVESRYTEASANFVLLLGGPILFVFVLFGQLAWGWSIFAAVLTFLLWRNVRRYRERVFHAIAERDRPPAPAHPDSEHRRKR